MEAVVRFVKDFVRVSLKEALSNLEMKCIRLKSSPPHYRHDHSYNRSVA